MIEFPSLSRTIDIRQTGEGTSFVANGPSSARLAWGRHLSDPSFGQHVNFLTHEQVERWHRLHGSWQSLSELQPVQPSLSPPPPPDGGGSTNFKPSQLDRASAERVIVESAQLVTECSPLAQPEPKLPFPPEQAVPSSLAQNHSESVHSVVPSPAPIAPQSQFR